MGSSIFLKSAVLKRQKTKYSREVPTLSLPSDKIDILKAEKKVNNTSSMLSTPELKCIIINGST